MVQQLKIVMVFVMGNLKKINVAFAMGIIFPVLAVLMS